jgi:hypothetical protein
MHKCIKDQKPKGKNYKINKMSGGEKSKHLVKHNF